MKKYLVFVGNHSICLTLPHHPSPASNVGFVLYFYILDAER